MKSVFFVGQDTGDLAIRRFLPPNGGTAGADTAKRSAPMMVGEVGFEPTQDETDGFTDRSY